MMSINKILVPGEGIEPTRCHHHRILSPARLPVPPSGQARCGSICDRRPGKNDQGSIGSTHAAYGLSLRSSSGSHRPAPDRGAFRQPPVGARWRERSAPRPRVPRFALAVDAAGSPGVQRHARRACADSRGEGERRQDRNSARTRAGVHHRAGACAGRQGVEGRGAGVAARRRHGAHAGARRRTVPPRILRARAAVLRGPWRHAAAALCGPGAGTRRSRALSDRVCPQFGRGGGAHGGSALRCGYLRRARGARSEACVRHPARRGGYFSASARGGAGRHIMHEEYLEVPESTAGAINAARAVGGRVIAVGTTVVRSLETAAAAPAARGRLRPYKGATRLFIKPGDRFRIVDAMVTNFHLPESTLLMLCAAFVGRETLLAAYAHAIAAHYRLFSYGDAMFLTPGIAQEGT